MILFMVSTRSGDKKLRNRKIVEESFKNVSRRAIKPVKSLRSELSNYSTPRKVVSNGSHTTTKKQNKSKPKWIKSTKVIKTISSLRLALCRCKNSQKGKEVKEVKETETDPITLEPIGKHVFDLISKQNNVEHKRRYNIDSLADWCLKTGNFFDPVSKVPFTQADCQNIDKLLVSYGISKSSVESAFLKPKQFENAKFHTDALLGIDRLLGDLISEILSIVDGCNTACYTNGKKVADAASLIDDATFDIEDLWPEINDYFSQMRTQNPQYALQCMKHYILFCKGPPNKRLPDPCSLLKKSVIPVLESMNNGTFNINNY